MKMLMAGSKEQILRLKLNIQEKKGMNHGIRFETEQLGKPKEKEVLENSPQKQRGLGPQELGQHLRASICLFI